MDKLQSNIKYSGKMDKEVIALCDALNALPSIETFESCCGHGADPFCIWFKVTDSKEGLFFLTRCVDNRYWEYGYLWKLDLRVGDMFKNNHLPIHYLLSSGNIVGDHAYKQAESLVENMDHHINHEGFMDDYKLNINNFETTK